MQNNRYTAKQQIKYIRRLRYSLSKLNMKKLPMIADMVLNDAIVLERLSLESLNIIVAILKKTLSDEHVRLNNELLKSPNHVTIERVPRKRVTIIISK